MTGQMLYIIGFVAFLLALVWKDKVGWAALMAYCLYRLLG